VLVGLAMRYLPIGRQILAVGNGQLSAAYSGIKIGRVMAVVFGASGFFAGVGGLMIVGWIDAASPRTADNLLLPCIAAVIMGGTAITGGLGSIGRTVVGAMIMAVLRVGLDVAGIEAKYQPVIFGALIVIAVAATIDRSRMTIVK
jgi:ribose transport system permease protein